MSGSRAFQSACVWWWVAKWCYYYFLEVSACACIPSHHVCGVVHRVIIYGCSIICRHEHKVYITDTRFISTHTVVFSVCKQFGMLAYVLLYFCRSCAHVSTRSHGAFVPSWKWMLYTFACESHARLHVDVAFVHWNRTQYTGKQQLVWDMRWMCDSLLAPPPLCSVARRSNYKSVAWWSPIYVHL